MIFALTDLSSSSASRGKMRFLDGFFHQIQWLQHSFLLIYAKESSIVSLNEHNLTMTHQKWKMLYWSKECMSWFFIILSRRPLWLMKCWYLIHRVDAVDNAARYAWESRTIVYVCLYVQRSTKAVFIVAACTQVDPQMVLEWHVCLTRILQIWAHSFAV